MKKKKLHFTPNPTEYQKTKFVEIPSDVIELESYSYSIDAIKLTVPSSVKKIDKWAFAYSNIVEVLNLSSVDPLPWPNYFGYNVLNYYTPTKGRSYLETTDNGLIFYDDGTVCFLVGYIGEEDKLTLPDNYKGKPYAIYDSAFSDNKTLAEITIPHGVKAIGERAFLGCNNLRKISIPKGIKNIEKMTFYDTAIEEIELPDIENICDYAFDMCEKLVKVKVSNAIKYISGYAFADSIKSIILPKSLRENETCLIYCDKSVIKYE